MAAPKGHPRYGGRAKGQPNKATREVKELAGKHTAEAIKTLASIMRNGETEAARVAAVRELLDRAHGKPGQSIDANVTGDMYNEVIHRIIDECAPD